MNLTGTMAYWIRLHGAKDSPKVSEMLNARESGQVLSIRLPL